MLMHKTGKLAALTLAMLIAAGCTTKGGKTDGQVLDPNAGHGTSADGITSGVGQEGFDSAYGSEFDSPLGDNANDEAALRAITTFYFEFDSSDLTAEAIRALDVHANDLKHSNSNVVLEGHTDERGTREYNMALGERRARAVQRYLALQGVSSSQLELVSYGEEMPKATGSSESSWAQNRRVELRK